MPRTEQTEAHLTVRIQVRVKPGGNHKNIRTFIGISKQKYRIIIGYGHLVDHRAPLLTVRLVYAGLQHVGLILYNL